MMKLTLLLTASIAGVSAFAPTSQVTTSRTQLNAADLETLRGVGPETGGKVVSVFFLLVERLKLSLSLSLALLLVVYGGRRQED